MATAFRTDAQSTVVSELGHVDSRKACSMKMVSAIEEDDATACERSRRHVTASHCTPHPLPRRKGDAPPIVW